MIDDNFLHGLLKYKVLGLLDIVKCQLHGLTLDTGQVGLKMAFGIQLQARLIQLVVDVKGLNSRLTMGVRHM